MCKCTLSSCHVRLVFTCIVTVGYRAKNPLNARLLQFPRIAPMKENLFLRRRLVTKLACFLLAMSISSSAYAVDLEFAAGSARERFMEITYAEVMMEQSFAASLDGSKILQEEAVYSMSFAGANHHTQLSQNSHTEVSASIYTNIARDSPEAVFAIVSAELELPSEISDIPRLQGGYSNSNSEAVDLRSSIHVFSTNEESSDPNAYVEFVLDELTGQAVDVIWDPPLTEWQIRVSPSPGEVLGTPTLVEIDAILGGVLDATGPASATAKWFVTINEETELISGQAEASELQFFGESGSHDFVVPLGESFKLSFLWELSLTASDVSEAAAQFTQGEIRIKGTLIPEPTTLTLLSLASLGLLSRINRSRF